VAQSALTAVQAAQAFAIQIGVAAAHVTAVAVAVPHTQAPLAPSGDRPFEHAVQVVVVPSTPSVQVVHDAEQATHNEVAMLHTLPVGHATVALQVSPAADATCRHASASATTRS
jgi:hypothetical protein